MKAVVLPRYGSPRELELREVPRPEPGEGQVQLQVAATSVNDWDWCLVRGRPFYIRLLCGLRTPRVRIPGVDVAGVVSSVGAGVRSWSPGDRVFGDLSESGFGAFAEYVCVDQAGVARAPANATFVEAAALPHAATLALQALRRVAGLRSTDRLLVNGAGGGMGVLAVQIARHLGVAHVTGVDHGDKLESLRALGYDEVADYRTCDFTRTGERYDVILDAKTNRPPTAYARALRPGGRYVTVGGETGHLLCNGLLGPLLGRLRNRRFRVLGLKPNQDLDWIRELCEGGGLSPVVDRVFPLAQVAEALQRFGDGLHTGKVVVEVAPGAAG